MQLSIRFYPGTGPIIRDHIQAAMIGALSDVLHERWQPTPEVRVHQPVRGVIDLVLEAPEPPLVSCEGHSQLRRLEQQVRWASAKSEALAQARGRPVSRLLLLHSSRRMRAVVAEYVSFLRAAFPASTASAYAALAGDSAWPGDAILWCDIRGSRATVLQHPPRGVALGR